MCVHVPYSCGDNQPVHTQFSCLAYADRPWLAGAGRNSAAPTPVLLRFGGPIRGRIFTFTCGLNAP